MFVFAECATVLDIVCMGDGILTLVFCGNATGNDNVSIILLQPIWTY